MLVHPDRSNNRNSDREAYSITDYPTLLITDEVATDKDDPADDQSISIQVESPHEPPLWAPDEDDSYSDLYADPKPDPEPEPESHLEKIDGEIRVIYHTDP